MQIPWDDIKIANYKPPRYHVCPCQEFDLAKALNDSLATGPKRATEPLMIDGRVLVGEAEFVRRMRESKPLCP